MKDEQSPLLQDDSLSVEVTSRCNSSCSHCFVRARGARRETLSVDLVQDLLQEGHGLGYRHLHITGGEPLMWDGLSSILDYAFALGYETVFLNTNGHLLTGDVCRELAAHKGLTISVSLQGSRSLHDSIRGKGSYDLAFLGVKNAVGHHLSVHIFTVVGKRLLPNLQFFGEGLFAALPEIKRLVFIQLIRVPADIFDLSEEVLSPDDFITFVRKVSFLSLYGLKVNVLNNPLAAVASRALNMPWFPPSQPLYRPGSVMITADLRVTLAHSTTHYLGSYEPGALGGIIGSDRYRRAVSGNRSRCRNCSYSTLCSSGGMAGPSEWYRDMSSEVPYCVRVLAKASSYG